MVWQSLFYPKFLEKILMSTEIDKFNDYNKRQKRSFVISTKYIFNLKGYSIKSIYIYKIQQSKGKYRFLKSRPSY